MLLADVLQTKILSSKESMGSWKSLQTLERVGIIWESFVEEEAWGMVGLELVSRDRRGGLRWQCPRDPWEEKEWSKLVKGPGHHGGPRRMVEDLSVGGKARMKQLLWSLLWFLELQVATEARNPPIWLCALDPSHFLPFSKQHPTSSSEKVN